MAKKLSKKSNIRRVGTVKKTAVRTTPKTARAKPTQKNLTKKVATKKATKTATKRATKKPVEIYRVVSKTGRPIMIVSSNY